LSCVQEGRGFLFDESVLWSLFAFRTEEFGNDLSLPSCAPFRICQGVAYLWFFFSFSTQPAIFSSIFQRRFQREWFFFFCFCFFFFFFFFFGFFFFFFFFLFLALVFIHPSPFRAISFSFVWPRSLFFFHLNFHLFPFKAL